MKFRLGIVHFSEFILSCSSSTDRLTLHCSGVLVKTTPKEGWAEKGAVIISESHKVCCVFLWSRERRAEGRKVKQNGFAGFH